jgi:hypothetical protein
MGMEKRKEERNKVYAKVMLVNDLSPGYLRDLSKSGAQISFLKQVPAKEGEALLMRVIHGDEIGIPPFKLTLTVRWTGSDPVYYSLGGTVTAPPDEGNQGLLARLYAYYADRQDPVS